MSCNHIAFPIQQQVRIIELDLLGIVKRISIEDQGTLYEVRYFWNSEAKYAFFYENELEKIK